MWTNLKETLFSPKGRMPIPKYFLWKFIICTGGPFLLMVLWGGLAFEEGLRTVQDVDKTPLSFLDKTILSFLVKAGLLIFPVVCIILIWSHIAFDIKRLHDMGYSGWLCLVPIFFFIIWGALNIMASRPSMFFTIEQWSNTENIISAAIWLFKWPFWLAIGGYYLQLILGSSMAGENRIEVKGHCLTL